MATSSSRVHRILRRTWRALMIASIAIIPVCIATLAATSGEPSPKPGPVTIPEGNATPAPRATSPTVPALVQLPEGVACPSTWSYFDNPDMHYGLCVPAGWGFSDFRDADPLERVPTVQLENLHLLGNAFPWHRGTLPFDAVRRGAIDVELDILPQGTAAAGECQPSTRRLLGLLSVLTCEQRYDDAGLPSASGSLRALKMIVPLRTAPAGEPGARLLIIARTRADAPLAEVTTLWLVVQNVHPY